jgi:hypothetical protein
VREEGRRFDAAQISGRSARAKAPVLAIENCCAAIQREIYSIRNKGQRKSTMYLMRCSLVSTLTLFIVLLPWKNSAKASQGSQKAGTLIVDVTWGDAGNTPANDVYIEAHGFVANSRSEKSFVLKMSHNGEYVTSLPPGVYDVFVSEGTSFPRCRRILIKEGFQTYWHLKLEIDDIYLGNAAGNPSIKH